MHIIFNENYQLANHLLMLSPRGAASLQSSVIPAHRIKGFREEFPNGVIKTKLENIWLGSYYVNLVNLRRVREDLPPDFEPDRRSWGQRITPQLIKHCKKQFYLSYAKNVNINSVSSTIVYHNDLGDILTQTDLNYFKGCFATDFDGSKGIECAKKRQGVDNPAIVRTVSINHIVAIKCGGETFLRKGYTLFQGSQDV